MGLEVQGWGEPQDAKELLGWKKMVSQSCESVWGPAGILQKTSAEQDERIPVLLQARMTQRERHAVAPWVEEGAPLQESSRGFFCCCCKLGRVTCCFHWIEAERLL